MWTGLVAVEFQRAEPQYVQFPGGEPHQRILASLQQLRDHFGVERGAAGGEPAQRLEELGDVGDPVLQQVPECQSPRFPEIQFVRSGP